MLFTKKNFEWHFLTKPVNMIIDPTLQLRTLYYFFLGVECLEEIVNITSLLFTRYLVQARAGFAIHWTHN